MAMYLIYGYKVDLSTQQPIPDASKHEFVGFSDSLESARRIWQSKAQSTVDDATRKYVIVDITNLNCVVS